MFAKIKVTDGGARVTSFATGQAFVLALAAPGLFFIFLYFLQLARAWTAQRWPGVQGTVLASWIEEQTTSNADGSLSYTYAPRVRYRYAVMGVEYRADRISFRLRQHGKRSSAEKVVGRYPGGSRALVYFNPERPGEAVLERSAPPALLAVGSILVAIAFWVFPRLT